MKAPSNAEDWEFWRVRRAPLGPSRCRLVVLVGLCSAKAVRGEQLPWPHRYAAVQSRALEPGASPSTGKAILPSAAAAYSFRETS